MDLQCVKLIVFFTVIATTHNAAISAVIDADATIKQNHYGTNETSKDDTILDKIGVLENEMITLRQENERIRSLLNQLIDLQTLTDQEQQPEHLGTTNTTDQRTDKDSKNDDATSFESKTRQQEHTGLLRRRRDAVVGGIAFTAYLTHNVEHAAPGQVIKFDQVLLNDGAGYNSYTGSFTAPVTGTYLFTFHFDTHKLTFIRLVLNGVNQVDAVANEHTGVRDRPAQSMGGNTAILHVLKGEAVLLETYEVGDSEVNASNTFRLSSFSGVLLY